MYKYTVETKVQLIQLQHHDRAILSVPLCDRTAGLLTQLRLG